MVPPSYQYLSAEDMVRLPSPPEVDNRLLAGNYGDLKGPIKTESDLLVVWGTSNGKTQMTYEIPEDFSACIYLAKGNLRVGEYGLVEKEHLINFDSMGDEITIEFDENAEFLLLGGRPIGEKVVQQGPFVMNSETEILEAMRDYQMGKMGILIEEFDEPETA